MKAEGIIRHVGITTSHGRRHREVEQIMASEDIDFVQLTYNITHREAENRLLPLAEERGIGMIANRPYDGGSLIKNLKRRNAPLPEWANAECGCNTWADFLLKFIVSHPAITCAIPATTLILALKHRPRLACLLPAPLWAFVAVAFFIQRYAELNWAGGYVGYAFIVQAVLLVLMALTGWGMDNAPRATRNTATGCHRHRHQPLRPRTYANANTADRAAKRRRLVPGGSVRHSCRPHGGDHAGPDAYHAQKVRSLDRRPHSRAVAGGVRPDVAGAGFNRQRCAVCRIGDCAGWSGLEKH